LWQGADTHTTVLEILADRCGFDPIDIKRYAIIGDRPARDRCGTRARTDSPTFLRESRARRIWRLPNAKTGRLMHGHSRSI
jgi:hypothetical protein